MRILLSIILYLFCVLNLNGQSKTMHHLFNDNSNVLSPFINPTYQYSQIALQTCMIPGIRAGIIINNKLLIGGVYNFASGDIALPVANGAGKLQMKWGGLHLEYIFWPLQVVHLTIPFSAGIGKMNITESTNTTMTGDPSFYFAEPGLMVEINVWKYAKLGFGTSYRYTRKVGYNSLTRNELNGFSAVASIKFAMTKDSSQKMNKRDPIEPEIKIKTPGEKKANSPRVKKRKSPR